MFVLSCFHASECPKDVMYEHFRSATVRARAAPCIQSPIEIWTYIKLADCVRLIIWNSNNNVIRTYVTVDHADTRRTKRQTRTSSIQKGGAGLCTEADPKTVDFLPRVPLLTTTIRRTMRTTAMTEALMYDIWQNYRIWRQSAHCFPNKDPFVQLNKLTVSSC